MPFTGPGDASLPNNVASLPENKRNQWVNVFNSAMSRCESQDGDDCEAVAFRQANGVVFDEMALFTPPTSIGIEGRLSSLAVREMAAGNGVASKWARKVVKKLNRAKEAAMEKTEFYDDAMTEPVAVLVAGPTSLFDLRAAQEANEAANQIHELTYQFQDVIRFIMADSATVDKATALESAADEFATLSREILGDALEEDESAVELAEITISESSIGHVTRMLEAGDVITGGKKPLLLEVVPIQPGWGNERDNNYYPASMLERCFAAAFDGVKMYETNHIPEEINNKNWVSTYVKTNRFVEGAPMGLVGVHDPLFAQKIINLVELEKTTGEPLLNKLECSIRGGGSATPGFELNGRSGKRVRELSEGLSIDWVSRGGAKGHAARLLESEEEMLEKDKELETDDVQTEPVKEVKIEETTQPDEAQAKPEPVASEPVAPAQVEPVVPAQVEPAAPQEVAKPVFLTEADVKALVPDYLPDETKARLLERQFPNEDEARRVITVEIDYLMAVTSSGKANMAEATAAPIVNVIELAEQQRERQSNVNKQFLGG